jgi:hypothetical protein
MQIAPIFELHRNCPLTSSRESKPTQNSLNIPSAQQSQLTFPMPRLHQIHRTRLGNQYTGKTLIAPVTEVIRVHSSTWLVGDRPQGIAAHSSSLFSVLSRDWRMSISARSRSISRCSSSSRSSTKRVFASEQLLAFVQYRIAHHRSIFATTKPPSVLADREIPALLGHTQSPVGSGFLLVMLAGFRPVVYLCLGWRVSDRSRAC